jgi:hypothetical protein
VLSQHDFPSVKFWTHKAFLDLEAENPEIAGTLVIDDNADQPRKIQKPIAWFEHEDGTPHSVADVREAAELLRSIAEGWYAACKGTGRLLPTGYLKLASDLKQDLLLGMLNRFPNFALCENHWKIREFGIKYYNAWSRTARKRKDTVIGPTQRPPARPKIKQETPDESQGQSASRAASPAPKNGGEPEITSAAAGLTATTPEEDVTMDTSPALSLDRSVLATTAPVEGTIAESGITGTRSTGTCKEAAVIKSAVLDCIKQPEGPEASADPTALPPTETIPNGMRTLPTTVSAPCAHAPAGAGAETNIDALQSVLGHGSENVGGAGSGEEGMDSPPSQTFNYRVISPSSPILEPSNPTGTNTAQPGSKNGDLNQAGMGANVKSRLNL